MKKNIISAIMLSFVFGSFMKVKSQNNNSSYVDRKLKTDEINFISGYYTQEGNHSSIGGGYGDEKLTNISNSLQVKLIKNNKKWIHHFDVTLAVDHHTSASTTYVNTAPTIFPGVANTLQKVNTYSAASTTPIGTNAVSSASTKFAGWRIYPSINFYMNNIETNSTFGIGSYYSREFDYQSIGGEVSFSKSSKDNNTEFSAKAMAFFDQRLEIIPVELRPNYVGEVIIASDDDNEDDNDDTNYKLWNKNSYSVNFAFSKVINKRLQISLLGDFAYQNGLLSIPYNRVYFTNNSVGIEKLPMNRLKIPFGMRLNYFLGESIIFRTYYRYFFDDWGIKAHTAQLEIPIKLSPFLSLSPFIRYHHQTSNDYFKPFGKHESTDQYYSSDYDLSNFTSQNIGLNLRYLPFDSNFLKSLDVRYSYYKRSEGLSAHNITLAFSFK